MNSDYMDFLNWIQHISIYNKCITDIYGDCAFGRNKLPVKIFHDGFRPKPVCLHCFLLI